MFNFKRALSLICASCMAFSVVATGAGAADLNQPSDISEYAGKQMVGTFQYVKADGSLIDEAFAIDIPKGATVADETNLLDIASAQFINRVSPVARTRSGGWTNVVANHSVYIEKNSASQSLNRLGSAYIDDMYTMVRLTMTHIDPSIGNINVRLTSKSSTGNVFQMNQSVYYSECTVSFFEGGSYGQGVFNPQMGDSLNLFGSGVSGGGNLMASVDVYI